MIKRREGDELERGIAFRNPNDVRMQKVAHDAQSSKNYLRRMAMVGS